MASGSTTTEDSSSADVENRGLVNVRKSVVDNAGRASAPSALLKSRVPRTCYIHVAPATTRLKAIDFNTFRTIVQSNPLGLAVCVQDPAHAAALPKSAMVMGLLLNSPPLGTSSFESNQPGTARFVLDPRMLESFLKNPQTGTVAARGKAYLLKTPLGCTLNVLEHLRDNIARIEFVGKGYPAPEAHQVALSFRKKRTELICPWRCWDGYTRWVHEYGKRLRMGLRVKNVCNFLQWLTTSMPSEIHDKFVESSVNSVFGLTIPHLPNPYHPKSAMEIFVRLFAPCACRKPTDSCVWQDDPSELVFAQDHPALRIDFEDPCAIPDTIQSSHFIPSLDFLATVLNRVFRINDFVCFADTTADFKNPSPSSFCIRAGYIVHRVGVWFIIRNGYNYHVIPIVDGVFKLNRFGDYFSSDMATAGALVAVSIKAGDLRLALLTNPSLPPCTPARKRGGTKDGRATRSLRTLSSPLSPTTSLPSSTPGRDDSSLYHVAFLSSEPTADSGNSLIQTCNPLLLSFVACTGTGYAEVCAFRQRGSVSDIRDIPKTIFRSFAQTAVTGWDIRPLPSVPPGGIIQFIGSPGPGTGHSLEALTDELPLSSSAAFPSKVSPIDVTAAPSCDKMSMCSSGRISVHGDLNTLHHSARATKRKRNTWQAEYLPGEVYQEPAKSSKRMRAHESPHQPATTFDAMPLTIRTTVSSTQTVAPQQLRSRSPDNVRLKLINALKLLASLHLNVIGNQDTGRLYRFTKECPLERAGDRERQPHHALHQQNLNTIYPSQWDLFVGDNPDSKLRKEVIQKIADKMSAKPKNPPQRIRTRRQKLQEEQERTPKESTELPAGSVEILRQFLSMQGVKSAVAFGSKVTDSLGDNGPPKEAMTLIDGGAVDLIMENFASPSEVRFQAADFARSTEPDLLGNMIVAGKPACTPTRQEESSKKSKRSSNVKVTQEVPSDTRVAAKNCADRGKMSGGARRKQQPLSLAEVTLLRQQLQGVLEQTPKTHAKWAAQVANHMAQMVVEGRISPADYLDLVTHAGTLPIESPLVSRSAAPAAQNAAAVSESGNDDLLRQLIEG